MIIDIVSIVFICVTANHLGLVKAVEDAAGRELPIINCVKCCTFWAVLAYSLWLAARLADVPRCLAISFLSSYAALWLELAEGYIDTLYTRFYEKIIDKQPTDTPASDTNEGNTAGTMP